MDFTWQFLNMLFMLLVVCVAAFVILKFFLPRFLGNKRFNKDGHFELISRYSLDIRRALYLVRIGKKYFVLGGAEQGLHLLSEISKDDLGEIRDEEKNR